MLETTKLLKCTKNKKTKDENGENLPRLESTKVTLVHCNIGQMIISMIHKSCIHLLIVNRLVNYKISHLKMLYF